MLFLLLRNLKSNGRDRYFHFKWDNKDSDVWVWTGMPVLTEVDCGCGEWVSRGVSMVERWLKGVDQAEKGKEHVQRAEWVMVFLF